MILLLLLTFHKILDRLLLYSGSVHRPPLLCLKLKSPNNFNQQNGFKLSAAWFDYQNTASVRNRDAVSVLRGGILKHIYVARMNGDSSALRGPVQPGRSVEEISRRESIII